MDHERVLTAVVGWAGADENVRAVVLTGSVARDDDLVDRFSDLDIELYVRDPASLLDSDAWFRRFGTVLVVEALPNDGWNPTRLVYYADGKIDFTIVAVDAARPSDVARRGYRVLLDKDDIAPRVVGGPPAPPPRPSGVDAFATCVHWFYAAALMEAKAIVRDEPWGTKVRDWDLKRQLLTMIEWDHKARKGWDYDTSHNGGQMRVWMDADVAAEVEDCWADFTPGSSGRALWSSVELFDTLQRRTASALGYEPFDSAAVHAELVRILGE